MNRSTVVSSGFEELVKMADTYLQQEHRYNHYKVIKNGTPYDFDVQKILATLYKLAADLPEVSIELVAREVIKNIYDGVSSEEIERAMVLAAVSLIEFDPAYDVLATRLLLNITYKETFQQMMLPDSLNDYYAKSFTRAIYTGIEQRILNPRMLEFNLDVLAKAIVPDRDYLLTYLGLQTLYDRYFIKVEKRRIESPQIFWMRIAMGLAINEPNKNERALEFYTVFSKLLYVPSTPTLFHAGFTQAQLSSCFLTTVNDDLGHIFKCIGDNAQLSKWAGGIGNDWTNIRATGALIKSIHSSSPGVIPLLKIANDVVSAITRNGIRRGGTCVYLETWHLDIEDFLDLRRNTGDERRRTHDLNTANWIPDLFMKRVEVDGEWTLFSPDETPDLHDLYGSAFEKRYQEYEKMAREGLMRQYKIISAVKLWRKMLSRLFETGHPWITFKDPCNVRSPQDHAGVIHSSNLCTEITLNTSKDETAVCNLGSVNLSNHIKDGQLDIQLLQQTVKSAIRMLDNVIDLNFYPTQEAEQSNKRHRPIGLGCMGFQDFLSKNNIGFDDEQAIENAQHIQEHILYFAVEASCELAQERGAYSSYKGSKWDRDIFPQDTVKLLEQERGTPILGVRKDTINWKPLREKVKQYGIRNSNVLAIAPTATIANIAGCFPSIEPIYKNIYVKSNIAGEFTIVNRYLVQELKLMGLWNKDMLDQIKYYDGDLAMISAIPDSVKRKYKTAFKIDPIHLIKIAAVRGQYIDQSQSLNIFMEGVSGKKMHDIYFCAYHYGIKTLYYLRTLGATQNEKSTLDAQKFGFTQKRSYKQMDDAIQAAPSISSAPPLDQNNEAQEEIMTKTYCDLTNAECESCQ